MKKKTSLLVFAALVISLFFLSACSHTTYNNDPFWNEVAGYFTDTARSKKELFNKMDSVAFEQVVPQANMDTASEIVNLFTEFKDNHNYEIRKAHDSVYICFNPGDEVASGPVFEIKKNDTSWKVMTIAFGK